MTNQENIALEKDKIGKLGKPTMHFRGGPKKRLNLLKKHIDFKSKKILDIGCGLGIYSNEFRNDGAVVFGIDVDKQKIDRAKELFAGINFQTAWAEKIPFADDYFDIVFLNEVLEHVENEEKVIKEIVRILKIGGYLILFVPNRYFPFETHGFYLGKKYIFGNIPLLNWLPGKIRNIFAPHVRIYTPQILKNLLKDKRLELKLINFVWPGFDKIESRLPVIGRILKKFGAAAEKNVFLQKFGVSICLIARKRS